MSDTKRASEMNEAVHGQAQAELAQKSAGVPNVSRRRLIRLGSAAVPVAATLASQPVLAWHCNTTSAWGSEQISANKSTVARNDANELSDECWSISEWRNNQYHSPLPGAPWNYLGCNTSNSSNSNYYKNYTLKKAFGTGNVPAGWGESEKVWDIINSSPNSLKASIVVAQLNSKYSNNAKTCLEGKLNTMAIGNFTPTNVAEAGFSWDSAKIQSYLHNNWIARQ